MSSIEEAFARALSSSIGKSATHCAVNALNCATVQYLRDGDDDGDDNGDDVGGDDNGDEVGDLVVGASVDGDTDVGDFVVGASVDGDTDVGELEVGASVDGDTDVGEDDGEDDGQAGDASPRPASSTASATRTWSVHMRARGQCGDECSSGAQMQFAATYIFSNQYNHAHCIIA